LKAGLQSQASSLGLTDRITFAGRQADIRPYLHAADVFVFPSRGESFGCALAEAMSTGLACVALRSDGAGIHNATDELIGHDHSGILVDKPDSNSIWSAIATLLSDNEKREKLGREARRVAESGFTWPAAGRRLNRIIQDVIVGALPQPNLSFQPKGFASLEPGA
jgi:glycosyltransferase involved in cell wall biosynthesis